MMNEDKEIPANVRVSLDQAYDAIRTKSNKKKVHFMWRGVATAACALLATGFLLTNEHVMANINDFFNFGDKGIERAVSEGFSQKNGSSAADQQIAITLDQHFADVNKMGLNFQLHFEDPSLLNMAEELSIEYRLKNGDGEYIDEFVSDTKPLKGDNQYLSGVNFYTSNVDRKAGQTQLNLLIESFSGNIPDLKDAVIEIESVHIHANQEIIKSINGEWKLAVANQIKGVSIPFVMEDSSSIIQVTKATAHPTSFNLSFSLEGIYENENTFAHHMKIIDENGNEYDSGNGFTMEKKKNKTIITTNFPLTSYQSSEELLFIIEGIGEVTLVKQ